MLTAAEVVSSCYTTNYVRLSDSKSWQNLGVLFKCSLKQQYCLFLVKVIDWYSCKKIKIIIIKIAVNFSIYFIAEYCFIILQDCIVNDLAIRAMHWFTVKYQKMQCMEGYLTFLAVVRMVKK